LRGLHDGCNLGIILSSIFSFSYRIVWLALGVLAVTFPFTLLHWFDGEMSRCRPRSLGLSGLINLISLLALALGIVGSEMITIESQIQNLSSAFRRGKPFQICGHRKFKVETLTTLFSGPVNPVKWPCRWPRRLSLSTSALTRRPRRLDWSRCSCGRLVGSEKIKSLNQKTNSDLWTDHIRNSHPLFSVVSV
jgi:hypothetical protein